MTVLNKKEFTKEIVKIEQSQNKDQFIDAIANIDFTLLNSSQINAIQIVIRNKARYLKEGFIYER